MIVLDGLHQRRQRRLHRAEHDHRLFDIGIAAMQVRVRYRAALNHRPRHHRKPGTKWTSPTENPGILLYGFPMIVAPREHAHVEAMHVVRAVRLVGHAPARAPSCMRSRIQRLGLGCNTSSRQRRRRALPRVVIRRSVPPVENTISPVSRNGQRPRRNAASMRAGHRRHIPPSQRQPAPRATRSPSPDVCPAVCRRFRRRR